MTVKWLPGRGEDWAYPFVEEVGGCMVGCLAVAGVMVLLLLGLAFGVGYYLGAGGG